MPQKIPHAGQMPLKSEKNQVEKRALVLSIINRETIEMGIESQFS